MSQKIVTAISLVSVCPWATGVQIFSFDTINFRHLYMLCNFYVFVGLELLQKYGVTSETFVNCWLGFSTTKLDGEGPSLETLIMFDKDVLSKENFAKTKIKSEPLSGSPIIHNITTISQM